MSSIGGAPHSHYGNAQVYPPGQVHSLRLTKRFDLDGQPTHFQRANEARVLYYYHAPTLFRSLSRISIFNKKSIFFLILRNGILKFEIGKMLFPTLVVIWSQLVKSGATSGQQQCQSFSTDNFYCKNVNYNQTFFPHRILESERIRTQVNTQVVRFAKPLNHLSGSGCCCDYWSLTNYWPLKTTENFQ